MKLSTTVPASSASSTARIADAIARRELNGLLRVRQSTRLHALPNTSGSSPAASVSHTW